MTDYPIGIPDAAVEAAAKALHDKRHPTDGWEHAAEYMTKYHWREQARIALAAAMPLIREQR